MTGDTLQSTQPPIVLTIAGSDCSGGAGIQADIKTISALGGYAASVITAVTAQNTLGVQAVYPLPLELVRQQIESVLSDLRPAAIKIGMVHSRPIVEVIARCLQAYPACPVVYDPVMISTSGRRLMTEETVTTIRKQLFPRCTLITPNLHEASLLAGREIAGVAAMEEAARSLGERYRTSFLVKGGHLSGTKMCDLLFCHGASHLYEEEKIESRNLHGTGCTLSSAIATKLACGHSLEAAVGQAKAYITTAIREGKELRIGQGNGPLWHFPHFTPESR